MLWMGLVRIFSVSICKCCTIYMVVWIAQSQSQSHTQILVWTEHNSLKTMKTIWSLKTIFLRTQYELPLFSINRLSATIVKFFYSTAEVLQVYILVDSSTICERVPQARCRVLYWYPCATATVVPVIKRAQYEYYEHRVDTRFSPYNISNSYQLTHVKCRFLMT